MLYLVCVILVDGDRSARKNTLTDVSSEISVDEKGAASVVSGKDHLGMADDKGRSNVGDELKEMSLSEMGVCTKPSTIKESTELVSSQSKKKKKKKKKASQETEIALNDTKGEEVKKEEHGSPGGTIY